MSEPISVAGNIICNDKILYAPIGELPIISSVSKDKVLSIKEKEIKTIMMAIAKTFATIYSTFSKGTENNMAAITVLKDRLINLISTYANAPVTISDMCTQEITTVEFFNDLRNDSMYVETADRKGFEESIILLESQVSSYYRTVAK